jgi:hypothetical protein
MLVGIESSTWKLVRIFVEINKERHHIQQYSIATRDNVEEAQRRFLLRVPSTCHARWFLRYLAYDAAHFLFRECAQGFGSYVALST